MMNTVDETGDRLVERPTRSITNGSPYPWTTDHPLFAFGRAESHVFAVYTRGSA
jgi:hypothetical protein